MKKESRVSMEMLVTSIQAIQDRMPATQFRGYVWHDGNFKQFNWIEEPHDVFSGSAFRIQLFFNNKWIDLFYQANSIPRSLESMLFNFIAELSTDWVQRIKSTK